MVSYRVSGNNVYLSRCFSRCASSSVAVFIGSRHSRHHRVRTHLHSHSRSMLTVQHSGLSLRSTSWAMHRSAKLVQACTCVSAVARSSSEIQRISPAGSFSSMLTLQWETRESAGASYRSYLHNTQVFIPMTTSLLLGPIRSVACGAFIMSVFVIVDSSSA